MSSSATENTKLETTENSTILADSTMDENILAEYLEAHPDFFQRHAALLQNMQVPHGTGTASLIERQVAVLKEKNRDLDEQLSGLIRTARGNEQIVTRLQRFTLELMRNDGIDDVIASCQEILREDFKADFVSLKLIGGNDTMHFIAQDNPTLQQFDKLFDSKRPVCGRLQDQQQAFLFEKNADLVKSVALVPLMGAERMGLLALGSKDEARFHPGMGVVFISHLGELVSTSLSRYL
ncbi:MAG TPA: DUF484 family protein [Leucothrix sp.]|nr:DUF484 family protein [Leucothrix sp.]